MRILIIILSFLFLLTASAQTKAPYDSLAREPRSFSVGSLDSLKADRNYQYEAEPVETLSLWQRFWRWFWRKYDEIMSTESGRTTMNIIYVVLGLAIVGFFIYRVARMNRLALFATDIQNKNFYSIEEENIHDISFENGINDAVANGDYRLAIRLLYLQNLKLLSDKNLIEWLPGKTNADYKRELKDKALSEPFISTTSIFEAVWYGHKTISQVDYEELGSAFSNFKNQLN